MAVRPFPSFLTPLKKSIERFAEILNLNLEVNHASTTNFLPDGTPGFLIPEIKGIQRYGIKVGEAP